MRLLPRRLARPVAAALAAALLAVAAPGGSAPPASAAASSALTADLDRLLADPRLAGATAAVKVVDTESGEVLYAHDSQHLVLPASTMKLVTSAAALDALGTGYRFGTDVLATGRSDAGVLRGDLVLRGGGDPSLLPQDLDALARQVADSGVRLVTGSLGYDASRYDDVPLGSGWAWDDEPYYYSPQISALTLAGDTDYDMGTLQVTLTPGEPGRPAAVRVVPADTGVRITGSVTTGPAGSGYSADVTRRHGTGEIVLSGSLPADNGPDDEWVTVDDPAGATAHAFAAALARHGVRVLGLPGRDPVATTTPAGARQVAHHDSAPLGDLLVPFLKLSNNGIAEHLVKELGRTGSGQGSWSAGLARITDFLHRNGLDTTPTRQADGSGLSRYDLVTADRYTALLTYARTQPWFATWYEALPIAGNPDRMVGGSLATRMQGTAAAGNVHAKTGSMSGVNTLAGYVTSPEGRKLAFAVLVNDFVAPSPRPVIDQIAVRLATGPAPAAQLRAQVERGSTGQPDEPAPPQRVHGRTWD
ncbi:D-alanyl-D-alanine carboxypeptidase/D-alanyl-D-alanine-endopeptidase (penicillin-binding protein 4) [Kitasatospora sp. SolWspMP-SS2h]|uniref:D-alanyl-D-alanine carboxypeptidase/D-alanyl-D-alanine endopeptidase n=1 Tax=Kitasatospora sp. SolWspMP-SS2h TaxID=1305729 RepID=UPI000DB97186|nr:D-alanyl-D-alanine carboxypeptidase/D-alanyl-D-alanine-endopeptidase [Kitasatospora sp. SolWspMP-SS2h]RAJ36849.1 D-alanyl-D-alanine carboxypeptidase/D-alanyl-D-alanine-endopeptidase (penicillin-binding protein 4) [Kitasatospora sp. SolWspMP-SS2h]